MRKKPAEVSSVQLGRSQHVMSSGLFVELSAIFQALRFSKAPEGLEISTHSGERAETSEIKG
jgi:hypothetical protein